ncbi:MAG TPA: hypothetical protein VFO40_28950, partial [Chthoniobacterales bacterium]|nr:hypothetical protein [Chthoniobacterales bacterium]
ALFDAPVHSLLIIDQPVLWLHPAVRVSNLNGSLLGVRYRTNRQVTPSSWPPTTLPEIGGK